MPVPPPQDAEFAAMATPGWDPRGHRAWPGGGGAGGGGGTVLRMTSGPTPATPDVAGAPPKAHPSPGLPESRLREQRPSRGGVTPGRLAGGQRHASGSRSVPGPFAGPVGFDPAQQTPQLARGRGGGGVVSGTQAIASGRAATSSGTGALMTTSAAMVTAGEGVAGEATPRRFMAAAHGYGSATYTPPLPHQVSAAAVGGQLAPMTFLAAASPPVGHAARAALSAMHGTADAVGGSASSCREVEVGGTSWRLPPTLSARTKAAVETPALAAQAPAAVAAAAAAAAAASTMPTRAGAASPTRPWRPQRASAPPGGFCTPPASHQPPTGPAAAPQAGSYGPALGSGEAFPPGASWRVPRRLSAPAQAQATMVSTAPSGETGLNTTAPLWVPPTPWAAPAVVGTPAAWPRGSGPVVPVQVPSQGPASSPTAGTKVVTERYDHSIGRAASCGPPERVLSPGRGISRGMSCGRAAAVELSGLELVEAVSGEDADTTTFLELTRPISPTRFYDMTAGATTLVAPGRGPGVSYDDARNSPARVKPGGTHLSLASGSTVPALGTPSWQPVALPSPSHREGRHSLPVAPTRSPGWSSAPVPAPDYPLTLDDLQQQRLLSQNRIATAGSLEATVNVAVAWPPRGPPRQPSPVGGGVTLGVSTAGPAVAMTPGPTRLCEVPVAVRRGVSVSRTPAQPPRSPTAQLVARPLEEERPAPPPGDAAAGDAAAGGEAVAPASPGKKQGSVELEAECTRLREELLKERAERWALAMQMDALTRMWAAAGLHSQKGREDAEPFAAAAAAASAAAVAALPEFQTGPPRPPGGGSGAPPPVVGPNEAEVYSPSAYDSSVQTILDESSVVPDASAVIGHPLPPPLQPSTAGTMVTQAAHAPLERRRAADGPMWQRQGPPDAGELFTAATAGLEPPRPPRSSSPMSPSPRTVTVVPASQRPPINARPAAVARGPVVGQAVSLVAEGVQTAASSARPPPVPMPMMPPSTGSGSTLTSAATELVVPASASGQVVEASLPAGSTDPAVADTGSILAELERGPAASKGGSADEPPRRQE